MTAALAEYDAFLARKVVTAPEIGFEVDVNALNPALFPWQAQVVRWALRRGRAAIWSECGTGKTLMQLVWAEQVYLRTLRPVLILAPLAVAQQTQREGAKFGIVVTVCRSQADVRPGVNVANYEMLKHFDAAAFGGIVLDESGILKSYMGSTKRAIIEAFAETRYKLACTATPAPNDHLELGNHAEFLGVMPSNEMIMRWFINDAMQSGAYRLKEHAREDYWRWVSSWAVSLSRPSDLGYPDDGFDLPELRIIPHVVEVDLTRGADGGLFEWGGLSATKVHRKLRRTAGERSDLAAELVSSAQGPCVVWCHTDYEADELVRRLPDALDVRGSQRLEEKERKLNAFSTGEASVLISKPSVCGFGMNWQHCANVVYLASSFSFEQFYQAVRRCWRFGQTLPVHCHVLFADGEQEIVQTITRKQRDHETMKAAMTAAMRETQLGGQEARQLVTDVATDTARGDDWELKLGDSCRLIRDVPDDSVSLSVYSPPFSNLYIYSDAVADMGNAADDDEFFEHYRYLIRELYRATAPGRLSAVHCKDLPLYKGRDGSAGLRDFPGWIIRAHEECGWTFHSRVTIWKCPVIEMQRTKNHGLLYKNLLKDSCANRQGMADYLLLFRAWKDEEAWVPVPHEREEFPLDRWQEWASPVWMHVQQTNVLNYQLAKDDRDAKHICPLQLDVIERPVVMYSNPGELVYDPFAGIGSTGVVSLRLGRRFLGGELKPSYFDVARRNLEAAAFAARQPNLLALMEG